MSGGSDKRLIAWPEFTLVATPRISVYASRQYADPFLGQPRPVSQIT